MPQNDFLPFATAPDANVSPQSEYATLGVLKAGFASGVARSPQMNKVWRQSSIMSAVLADFIVDQSGQAAIDDGSTATLEASLLSAIRAAARTQPILNDTGSAGAYVVANTPALSALPPASGLLLRVNIAHANLGASTLSVDGLDVKPIYGRALAALQGGELAVGIATFMWVVAAALNSGNGAWVLLESQGGAIQTPVATQSGHAVNLGQVRGLLGNYAGVVNVAGNVTLTQAQAGSFVETSPGAGGCTITLPSTTGIAAAAFPFYNNLSTAVTIAAAAGQGINLGLVNTPSITLPGGNSFTLITDGASWSVVGGNGAASLASSGYQKLPSGLIIQWGTITANSSGSSAVTFPIKFPVETFCVYPVAYSALVSQYSVSAGTPTVSGVTLYSGLSYSAGTAAAGLSMFWFAIGH